MPAVIREPCPQSVIEAQACPEEAGRLGPASQRRMVLAACILASSMAFIDGSALTVALPALRDDLDASLSTVQWVINAYTLSFAAFVLIGGSMADVYGKARVLIFGCVAFGLASAWCALAGSPGMLIAARFAQGLAAAVVAPASLALIGATYSKKDRNKAIGVWASASALTTAGGPILGGWLTESFGWPAIFWLNPPLAAAAIALLLVAKPADERQTRAFDLVGAALMAAALGLAAWGLSAIGPSEAGGAENAGVAVTPAALMSLAAGAALLGGYVFWELKTDHPMTPPRLFSNRVFTDLNLATFCIYVALSVIFFLMPFELIDRRGLSPTAAGAAFLPFTLCVGFLASPVGALADRVGAKAMLVFGSAAAGAAYALFVLLRDASFLFGILAPMAVLGVAFAAMIGPLTASVMSSVDEKDEGLASGVSNGASRIAQLVGVALAAGLAGYAGGFSLALWTAALVSVVGAVMLLRAAPMAASPA